jgi:hypothetical protein
LRFFHDGKDFASGYAAISQDRNRALAAVTLVTKQGDWHPSLDRPRDGVFHAEDFRLRYELAGPAATAGEVGDGGFALTAGDTRAIVHAVPGKFGPYDVL